MEQFLNEHGFWVFIAFIVALLSEVIMGKNE
jgi:hypothetical protein